MSDFKMIYDKEGEDFRLFEDISTYLYDNPEVGGFEFKGSKYLTDLLRKNNFEVTIPYCGIDTAFRAELINGEGPKIAFVAEYDALAGLGKNGNPAHGCGHNWIAATTCGAAILLSKMRSLFKGTVLVIGTPAEETFGAKVDMAERGGFNDIDICIQGHLGNKTIINNKSLAMHSLEFKFKGKPSHAAMAPFNGINALDAVHLMLAGINAFRQEMEPSARIHGIISNGGQAANIIPEYAALKITMRADNKKYLDYLRDRVIDIAKGAELMTHAEMSHDKFENSFLEVLNIPSLQCLMKESIALSGVDNIIDEASEYFGSTDLGNVSYVCPTSYVTLELKNNEEVFLAHEQSAVRLADSREAHELLHKIVASFVYCALKLYNDSKLLKQIKKEHSEFLKANGEIKA